MMCTIGGRSVDESASTLSDVIIDYAVAGYGSWKD